MNSTMTTSTALLLALLLVPAASNAQVTPLYSGLGFGRADYQGAPAYDSSLAPGQQLQSTSGFTELYVGYHFTDLLAVEIGYADARQMNHSYRLNPNVSTLVAVNNVEHLDMQKIAVDAVVEYPLARNLIVLGSLGYVRVNLDRQISGGLNQNSGGLRLAGTEVEDGIAYGVGLKYQVTDLYGLRLQQVGYSLGNIDLSTTRLSVELHF